jgi:hypothetical protein
MLLAASVAVSETVTIERLTWLSGCWNYDGRQAGSLEHWLRPAGGAMLAVSRVIRDGRMVSYEFLRVEETRDGTLRMIASPVGQATTAFDLAEIDAGLIVFENPEHDFPQRISYRLIDENHLIARAEAENDGETVGIDFPMTRGDCAASD